MSSIAAALAKATEQNASQSGLAPSAKPASHIARNTFWSVLSAIALVGIAMIFWSAASTDNQLSAAETPEASTSSSAVESVRYVQASPLATPAAKSTSAPATTTRITSPNPVLEQAVRSLPISASMPGEQPRIIIEGHLYRAGDKLSNGLVFHAIEDGSILFRDALGHLYARRL